MFKTEDIVKWMRTYALSYYGQAPASVLDREWLASQAWDEFAALWLGDEPDPLFLTAADIIIAEHAAKYGEQY